MSFFFNDEIKRKRKTKTLSKELLARVEQLGCKTCPLDNAKMLSPKFSFYGPKDAKIYLLLPSVTQQDDNTGEFLTRSVQRQYRNDFVDARQGTILRCYTENDKEFPLNCCRGFVSADIESVKPKVIVGYSEEVLRWITKGNALGGITSWRGKPFPVVINKHTCWFVLLDEPDFLDLKRINKYKILTKYSYDVIYKLDVDRVYQYIKIDPPKVQDKDYLNNCYWIFGKNEREIRIIERWCSDMANSDVTAFDFETQNVRPYKNNSKLISVSITDETRSVAFPFINTNKKFEQRIIKAFIVYLSSPFLKIAHNLKFELEWISYTFGSKCICTDTWEDTLSMSYVLDERKRVTSLEFLVYQYLGFNLKALNQDLDKTRMLDEYLNDPEKVLKYNALDSKYTYKLYFSLLEEFRRTENKILNETYEFHLNLCTTLVHSQVKGIGVNLDLIDTYNKKLVSRIEDIVNSMNQLPEVEKCIKKFGNYNPGSPDHNVWIFRDYLMRKEGYIDSTDSYSTDEEHLLLMPKKIELAQLLLEYRKLTKLNSNYIIGTKAVTQSDGKVHTNYNHTFVSTGRLSSEDPNLQNYPSRKDKWVREIIQEKGYMVASFDYGQIDARNIAMYSQDDYYIDALWHGLDIHQDWTERFIDVYPRKLDQIAKEFKIHKDDYDKLVSTFRKVVKNAWTFPLFYGTTAAAASHHLDIPENYVIPLFEEFWSVFDGVKKWQDELIKFYLKYGYVETLNGRRRHGPMSREELLNAAIQGTTAEVVGDAMNRVSNLAYPRQITGRVWLPDEQYQPPIQIHDDLLFLLKDDTYLLDRCDKIGKVMCQIPYSWVCVPIVVEMKLGPNWYDQSIIKKEYVSTDYK